MCGMCKIKNWGLLSFPQWGHQEMSLGMSAQSGCLVLVHTHPQKVTRKRGGTTLFYAQQGTLCTNMLVAVLWLNLTLQLGLGTRMGQLSLNCLWNLNENCKCKNKTGILINWHTPTTICTIQSFFTHHNHAWLHKPNCTIILERDKRLLASPNQTNHYDPEPAIKTKILPATNSN